MAEFLASAGVVVDSIEHSEKLRVKQTAEILAAGCGQLKGQSKWLISRRMTMWDL